MYVEQELGSLVRCKPEEAKQRILEAYRVSDGLIDPTCKLLGVSRRSLLRWTKLLGLRTEVSDARVKAGRHPYNNKPSKKPAPKTRRGPARGRSARSIT